MITRKIVQIDEEKCDGCGLCVPSCEEGAIRIVDGKARLVSDIYCDGLGACLGHCPQGAITLIEREALEFDEAAVQAHSQAAKPPQLDVVTPHVCPGAAARSLRPGVTAGEPARFDNRTGGGSSDDSEEQQRSGLANWPVQLHLVPPQAPYLQDADVLLVADCVPFACADFHRRFLDGRPVVIGCPKLDDGQFYVQKLAQIIRASGIRRVSVLRMEVPCCMGLVHIARSAMELAQRQIPLDQTTISVRGQVLPDEIESPPTGAKCPSS